MAPTTAPPTVEPPPSSTPPLLPPAEQILNRVNAERAKAGLAPMSLVPCLNSVAQPWADHMAQTGIFEHQPLAALWDACPDLSTGGENIAMGQGSAAEAMASWMASQGHRDNILNPDFTQLGVGVAVSSSGTMYWVQDFGG